MHPEHRTDDTAAYINLKGGITVCVPRELNLMTPYVLLEQEDWFENEIGFIRVLAEELTTSFDIGANFGIYSLTLAKGGAPQSAVWAFEPIDQPRHYLEKSIVANDLNNINIAALALSSFSGSADMYSGANTEMSTLNQALAQEGSQKKSVAVSTLDEFCSEHALTDVDFIKIDAEGEEENVIRGGGDIFELSSPLVMFEIGVKERYLAVAKILQDQSYEIYRHVPALNCLAPVDPSEDLDSFQLNLFACKPDRVQWLIKRNLLTPNISDREARNGAASSAAATDLSNFPHFKFFDESWALEPSGTSFEQNTYLGAIAHYGLAQDKSRRISERFALLRASCDDLSELCTRRPTRGRLMTYARVANDCGDRTKAFRALSYLEKNFQDLEYDASEAFLPPCARFDYIDPRGEPDAWMRAAVTEQKLMLSTLTSYLAGDEYLDALADLKGINYPGAEIERRWQLMRLLRGKQTGIQVTEFLSHRSPENLNPEIWGLKD
jgi:FkbM family methyltransferase